MEQAVGLLSDLSGGRNQGKFEGKASFADFDGPEKKGATKVDKGGKIVYMKACDFISGGVASRSRTALAVESLASPVGPIWADLPADNKRIMLSALLVDPLR